MIDALEYLAAIQENNYLGIFEPINFNQKRMPIVLPRMQRLHLARLFGELGYKVGAEIGVCKGGYSKCLWRSNPTATIYSIDPWEAYDRYYEPYTPELIELCYETAKKKLAKTGCIIIREYSMEALYHFDDESLDFVFIDGNHEFQHVTNDIAEWSRKGRVGGIVSGHDYVRYKRHPAACHVKSVVNGWTFAHRIRPWFTARGKGGTTWFWVKDKSNESEFALDGND